MTPDERLNQAARSLGAVPLSPERARRLSGPAHEALAKEPKARSWWVDAVVVLALNLFLSVGAALTMSKAMVQHDSDVTAIVSAFFWLATVVTGSLVWIKPGRMGWRFAAMVVFVLACGFTLLSASGYDPGGSFWQGKSCAAIECAVALLPLVVSLGLSTRFAAKGVHMLTAALGAGAGGAMALHFHCPNGTPWHLLVFHFLPALFLGALAVGVRLLVPTRVYVP